MLKATLPFALVVLMAGCANKEVSTKGKNAKTEDTRTEEEKKMAGPENKVFNAGDIKQKERQREKTAGEPIPVESKDYLHQGDAKLEKGDYNGAADDYTKAIESAPGNGQAYLQRGISKIRGGNTASGCEDIKKAQQLGNFYVPDDIAAACK
jgi:tetratricopeptide (TPR) repeat protein